MIDTYHGGYSPDGYPRDWHEISLAIKTASGNRCEECGIASGVPHPSNGRPALIQVAHLDQIRANCCPENLKAMCQRCHSAHDRRYRSACRRAKLKAQGGSQVTVQKRNPRQRKTSENALGKYLNSTNQSAYGFYSDNGLTRGCVYSAVGGKPVTYHSAKAISDATGGEVTIPEIMKSR